MFVTCSLVIWVRGRRLNPVSLIRPCPPVEVFAAFTAKRAVRVARGVGAKGLAAWAGHFWHHERTLVAEGELKILIAATGAEMPILILVHQPDHDHQTMATDLRHQMVVINQANAHQLITAARWQTLLIKPCGRRHLVWHPCIPEHPEQQVEGLG